MIRFNYGGGRQTVAMCILIAREILPKPDITLIADTSRENPTTWEYMEQYTQPLMQSLGLEIEVAPHSLATVDIHGHNGNLLLPVWTETGKFSAYCSGEWKRDVCERHCREKGIKSGTLWLGFSFDERKRWRKSMGKTRHQWTTECPLVDKMITTQMCYQVIEDWGWPFPEVSSCWMCPHKRNAEWRLIRDHHPDLFESACQMDHEEREDDMEGGVWLHHSRVPLDEADLSIDEPEQQVQQCTLGTCFI